MNYLTKNGVVNANAVVGDTCHGSKMFHTEILNDADKMNEEVCLYKDTLVVSNVK